MYKKLVPIFGHPTIFIISLNKIDPKSVSKVVAYCWSSNNIIKSFKKLVTTISHPAMFIFVYI